MIKIDGQYFCSWSLQVFIGLLVLILDSCDNIEALAQVSDFNGQPQLRQPTPFILPPKLPESIPLPEKLPETPLKVSPENTPLLDNQINIPGSITVKRFKFEGNTAFNDQQLAQVVASFLNRPLTFAELLQAEAAINKLYLDAGYINSGAVIPSGQTFSPQEAIVKIKIIEGGVEEIIVKVDGRLHSDYIRSRLALATKKPLNQNRLLEALQVLQLNPLIGKISAELSAGTTPESSILVVKVQEAQTFKIEIFGDNSRVPSIGSFQRGISFKQNNLLGFGDAFHLDYVNTDGSNAIYANYTIPVNPYNGTIKFSSRLNYTHVIEKPFDSLDITGDSDYFDLSFRQPVIETPTQELALGITLSREESQTTLLGVNFPLSPGANNNGKTKISAIRFFQEWTQRGTQDVFAMRSQFSLGVGAFDATINDQPPDSRFFEWQAQGQYVRLLAPDTLLLLRSSLQLSSKPLVPLEQFSLGGLYTVRGYRQDVLLTDNGVFVSAEVRLPILRVEELEGVLQVAPFVDFGVGWNDAGNPIATPDINTLVSVGLGVQWQMADKFTARFDWGIPLTDIEVRGNTLQEDGLYFSINYTLF